MPGVGRPLKIPEISRGNRNRIENGEFCVTPMGYFSPSFSLGVPKQYKKQPGKENTAIYTAVLPKGSRTGKAVARI